MNRAIVSFLLVLLAGCSSTTRLDVPPPYLGTSQNLIAGGADASDLWLPPTCETSAGGAGTLSFWHYTGGWQQVVTQAACLGQSAGPVVSLENGSVLASDLNRLLLVNAKGEVTDHTLDADAVAGRLFLSVASNRGAAFALATDPVVAPNGGQITQALRLLKWNGSAFVEGSLPPDVEAGSLAVVGPDDLWFLAPPVSHGQADPGIPAAAWHFDGSAWAQHVMEGGLGLKWSITSPPDNLWMLHATDPTAGVLFDHYDGTAWSATTLPNPISEDLAKQGFIAQLASVHPGVNDEIHLRVSAVFSEGTSSRTNELAYTWDGKKWSEPEQLASYVLASCSAPPCGLHFFGELADGTELMTELDDLNGGDPHIVLWKP